MRKLRASQNPVNIRLVTTTTFSCPNNGGSALVFDTTLTRRGLKSSNISLASGAVTIEAAGVYLLSSGCLWANNSTGRRQMRIAVNGTVPAQSGGTMVRGTSSYADRTAEVLTLSLSAGDVITARPWQDSGSSLNITEGSLTVARLRSLVHARVRSTTVFSAPDGGGSDLTYDTTVDNIGCTVNLGNGRLTVSKAGVYLYTAGCLWSAFNNSEAGSDPYINGSFVSQSGGIYELGDGTNTYKTKFSLIMDLAASDYVTTQPYQHSGGSKNVNEGEFSISLIQET